MKRSVEVPEKVEMTFASVDKKCKCAELASPDPVDVGFENVQSEVLSIHESLEK